MNKEELLKAIEQKRQEIWSTDTGKMAPAAVPNNLEQGWLNALAWMERHINSLPPDEQPSDDLEDEIYNYWRNELTTEDIVTISKDDFIFHATHFAQWQKEQMMKSAIEVKINRDTLYNLKPIIHEKYQDLRIGDKVKVIIVKEDEQ